MVCRCPMDTTQLTATGVAATVIGTIATVWGLFKRRARRARPTLAVDSVNAASNVVGDVTQLNAKNVRDIYMGHPPAPPPPPPVNPNITRLKAIPLDAQVRVQVFNNHGGVDGLKYANFVEVDDVNNVARFRNLSVPGGVVRSWSLDLLRSVYRDDHAGWQVEFGSRT